MTIANYVRWATFLLILAALVWKPSVTTESQSQTVADGVLIYMRDIGPSREFVRQDSNGRTMYAIPLDKCTALSSSGRYFVQTSLEEDVLIVRYFNEMQTLILQTAWDENWEPCSISAGNVGAISVEQENDGQRHYFDFSNGQLVPVNLPRIPQVSANLPSDYMAGTLNDFRLASPQQGIYLYESCLNESTIEAQAGGTLCSGNTQFVIYDSNQQSVLHTLDSPDAELLTGINESVSTRIYEPGAAWSSTGRYLAYPPHGETPDDVFHLTIYDMNTNTYLDTQWANARIDPNSKRQWSPTTDKLVFWIIGRGLEEQQPGDNPETLRRLVIYDIATESFMLTDNAFDIEGVGSGTFSPDGLSYIFIDLHNNLVHVDLNTGVTNILDTLVETIIAWRSNNEQPTANAGPTQDVVTPDGGAVQVTFNGSASIDTDGTIAEYLWYIPDFPIQYGVNATFDLPIGEYVVTLQVTDDEGVSDLGGTTVTVRQNNPPTVTISYGFSFVEQFGQPFPNPVMINVNNEFYTDDPDGDALTYKWEMDRPDTSGWTTVYEGGDASANLNLGAPPLDYCPIMLRLTATDPYGASASATTTVNFVPQYSTSECVPEF